MARRSYNSGSLRPESRRLLDQTIKIVEGYEARGYQLTVRQLYYQLVSRNLVPNTTAAYQRISKLVTKARMSREIEWDSIVDRARRPIMPGEYKDMAEFIRAVRNSYRRRRWEGQRNYVEVLVEKDALAGILEPVTSRYHVLLLANKGYLSASAMHDLAQRLLYNDLHSRKCHILYLGDHDPSGLDMVRDISYRTLMFDAVASIDRLALNMNQIKRYKPPPNPAKMSDPRADEYIREYGSESWELDALDPAVLADMVERGIRRLLDIPKYEAAVAREAAEKEDLDRVVAAMMKKDGKSDGRQPHARGAGGSAAGRDE